MDKDQVKQSRSAGKAGSRDAKALRNNANRTTEAPDMPDMTETSALSTVVGPTDETQRICVRLRRQGRTFPQIAEALGVPLDTLHEWKAEHPDFYEGTRAGFDDFVEERAEEVLTIADQLPKVRGLKPGEKMIAMKHQMAARLQVAAARLSAWGRLSQSETGIMVLDVGLGDGPIKTLSLPGSPDGQNIKALEAGRWQIPPREEKLLERSPGDEDGPAAAGPGKRAHRGARAFPEPGAETSTPGTEGA